MEDRKRYYPQVAGIAIKKQFGQHFLRNQAIIDRMISSVKLAKDSSVFEIGCGDGVLTSAILEQDIARLWVFEIDAQWAAYVREKLPDPRLIIYEENILSVEWSSILAPHAPWVLLANLPYQITFPILYLIHKNRDVIREGVVMVQDEVAEKIMQKGGRGYGYVSLFFQHYFTWTSLAKVLPGDFYPPPKVHSRIIHFAPRTDAPEIPDEPNFWRFIKACFSQPRRTLRNNLASYHYDLSSIDDKKLGLRAQQMSMGDLLSVWEVFRLADTAS